MKNIYIKIILFVFLYLEPFVTIGQNSKFTIKSCSQTITISHNGTETQKQPLQLKNFEVVGGDRIVTGNYQAEIQWGDGKTVIPANKNISVADATAPPYFVREVSYWNVVKGFFSDFIVMKYKESPEAYSKRVNKEIGASKVARGSLDPSQYAKEFEKLVDSLSQNNVDDSIVIYLTEAAFYEKRARRTRALKYYERALEYSKSENKGTSEVQEIRDQAFYRLVDQGKPKKKSKN